MPKVPISFGVQSNPSRYSHGGDNRLINAYAEAAGPEGKIPFPIYAADGLVEFSDAGSGPTRNIFPLGATLYQLANRTLFPVDTAGTVGASLGGIPTDNFAYAARNRREPNAQIVYAADGLRYILEANVLNEITDTDLGPSTSVAVLDGYFGWLEPSARLRISGIDNGAEYDPLDFIEAEAQPDGGVRAFTKNREFIVFGEDTVESFFNSGASGFPFQRVPGGVIDTGCIAPASVARHAGSVAFVDDNKRVRLLGGSEPVVISNQGIEDAIERLADPSEIEAFRYVSRGHEWYVLSSSEFTWVRDEKTGFWHERESLNEKRWRASCHAKFNLQNIVGDFENGKLYRIDPEANDDAGTSNVWKVRSPIIHDFPNPVEVNTLYIDVIPGQGLVTGAVADTDPKIMMVYSIDGGKTWSNQQTAPIGKTGEYSQTVQFNIGQTTDEDGMIVELSASAGVCRGMTGAAGDLEPVSR